MNPILKNSAILFSAITISVLAGYAVLAWIEPAGAPPGNNVAAPINTSNVAQTKSGNFSSLGDMSAVQFCFGSNCIKAWPSAKTCATGEAIGSFTYNPATGAGEFTCKAIGSGGCTPATCASLGYICGGPYNDGCGGVIGSCDITPCPTGTYCVNGACGSTFSIPCNQDNAGQPYRRIFVTSATYPASTFTQDCGYAGCYVNKHADEACQNAANGRFPNPANYKALLWSPDDRASREPNSVLLDGKIFVNGQSFTGNPNCTMYVVATSKSDFFTKDSVENYLVNPIVFDESGAASGGYDASNRPIGVDVWTEFKPNGSGGYTKFDLSTISWDDVCWSGGGEGGGECVEDDVIKGLCAAHYAVNYMIFWETQTWTGRSNKRTRDWAYTSKNAIRQTWNACQTNPARALYCVETTP